MRALPAPTVEAAIHVQKFRRGAAALRIDRLVQLANDRPVARVGRPLILHMADLARDVRAQRMADAVSPAPKEA